MKRLRMLSLLLLISLPMDFVLAQDFGRDVEEDIKKLAQSAKERSDYERGEKDRYWKEVEASTEPWKVPEPRPWKPKPRPAKAPDKWGRRLDELHEVAKWTIVGVDSWRPDDNPAKQRYYIHMRRKDSNLDDKVDVSYGDLAAKLPLGEDGIRAEPSALVGSTFTVAADNPDYALSRWVHDRQKQPSDGELYERAAQALSAADEEPDLSDVDAQTVVDAFSGAFYGDSLNEAWFKLFQDEVRQRSGGKVTLDLATDADQKGGVKGINPPFAYLVRIEKGERRAFLLRPLSSPFYFYYTGL